MLNVADSSRHCEYSECENKLKPEQKRFCSHSCQFKAQWQDPNFRNMQSERVRQQWRDPEYRQMQATRLRKQWRDPEYRQTMSERMKGIVSQLWRDPLFRQMQSEKMSRQSLALWQDPDFYQAMSERMREQCRLWWQDPEHRELIAKKASQQWQDPEYRQMMSEMSQELWTDSEYRQKQSERANRLWQDPEYRQMMSEQLRQRWQDPEFRQMMSGRMSGENNPGWDGGTAIDPYDSDFNGALRSAIRKRDGYCCRICGLLENGRAHDVHHIDYDKANSTPSNLILLCASCHSRTNFNRDSWQGLLSRLVSEPEAFVQLAFWNLIQE